MWEIYSVGDAAFLERILNALAMLAGTGNLEQVAGIGMMVGVIILGFQSILGGGDGIKFQNLLVSWIIYGMMFGTGARVAIEDVYSGQVRVVDNVPFGVAAAGSMVTQLGYGVTSLFEQAFGEAQMTEQGFAFALETLANLRKMSLSKANLGSANSPVSGDDIWQSWKNYIADCTMTGVNLKQYTVEDIQKALRNGGTGGILEQLKFESQAYGTEVVLRGAANNGFYTCSDAFLVLSTHTNSNFVPALNRRAAEAFGVPADEVSDRVQQAFQAIEQSQIDAQNYMLTTAMAPIFDWAMVDNDVNFQRVSTAAMLHSAIQQRNEQWGAEQALFNTVVRPMMTFFEGLVFAITPMMAFLIGLGPMGIGLMGKYLMILLWIQLWMPVLAIINLYLHMAVGKKMAALQNVGMGNMPLESFYGLQSMDQTLQTWISTGGMLAASVPAITLMLIYGGAVTASSVAGRMSSASVPTNLSTPPLASNSPLLERGSMRQSNDAMGLGTTGAEGLKMQVNGGYSSALASSREEVAAKQQAFSQTLGSTLTRSQGSAEQAVSAAGAGITQTSQESDVYKAALKHGRNLTEGTSLSQSLTEGQLASIGSSAAVGAGLSASTGVGGKALGGGANGSAGMQFSTQIGKSAGLNAAQQKELSEKLGTNMEKSKESAAAFTNAVARENKSTDSNSFTRNVGLADSDALSKAATETNSASDKFTANDQLQRSMGIMNTMSDNKIAPELRNRGLDGDVKQFMATYGGQGGLNKYAESFYDTIKGKNPGMKDEDAMLAAQTFAIADGRFLDNVAPSVRDSMALQGAGLMSRIAGIDTPSQTAFGRNEGVGKDAGAVNVRDKVDSGVKGTGLTAAGVATGVESGMAGVRANIDSTSPSSAFENGQLGVDKDAGGFASRFGDDRSAMLKERVNGAAEANERNRINLGQSEAVLGGMTPDSLKENGISGPLSSNSNLSGILDRAGLPTGQDRSDFTNMTAEQQKQVAAETHAALANQLQANNMHPDVAAYAAGLMLPEAMGQMYSNGSMFGGPSADEVRNAAASASRDERMQSHDALYGGLTTAAGDSGIANVAMQDIAKSSVAMMNLGSHENGQLAAQMTNTTLGAVGYEGVGGAWNNPAPTAAPSNNQAIEDYIRPSTPATSPGSLNPVIHP